MGSCQSSPIVESPTNPNERRNYRVDVVRFCEISVIRVKEITSKKVWLTNAVFLIEQRMMAVPDGYSLKVHIADEGMQTVRKMKIYGTRLHEKFDSQESIIFDTSKHYYLSKETIA